MRKIYSLVLLAAALLVGTNAWAQASVRVTYNTGSYATNPRDFSGDYALQDAVKSILPGDSATITLLQDQSLKSAVVIPLVDDTTDAYGAIRVRPAQRICLNLNGKVIEDDEANTSAIGCIHLVKGTLHITGNGELKHNKAGGSSNWDKSVITVAGAPAAQKQTFWSTLIIDEQVFINSLGNGQNYGLCIQNSSAMPSNIVTKTGYTTYYASNADNTFTNCHGTPTSGVAYGVRVYIKGDIFGNHRGINVVGTINVAPDCDENWTEKGRRYPNPSSVSKAFYYENYYPYLKIYSTSEVWCKDNGLASGNGGIYAGGYCVWDISGNVHGQTGIFMKSGDVVLTDATVASDSEVSSKDGNYGGSVSGTGIFIASDNGYAGDVQVTIAGDTKVQGGGEAAIVDVYATNTTETQVSNITITGGTIEPGTNGAIELTTGTGEDKTTVVGGNIQGDVTVGDNTATVSSLVPNEGYHTTTVTDPETGKNIVIVTTGDAPTTKTLAAAISEYNTWVTGGKIGDAPSAKIDEALSTTLSQNLEFKELELNSSNTQDIYIPAGKTLTVGRLIMGAYATIFIEPEAKLIVNGEQGVVAPVVTNLIIRVNEDKQGALLFNPKVSSNRQPYATVQLYTVAHQIDESSHAWHRFTSPLAEATGMTYTMGGIPVYGGAAFFTSISEWDHANQTWSAPLANVSQMNPFAMYSMTNNAQGPGVRYNFKGRIQGTISDELPLSSPTWNYYGNAYTGTMNLVAMLDNLENDNVEKTVWIWTNTGGATGTYANVTYDILTNPELETFRAFDTVAALKTLVFKMKEGIPFTGGSIKLDYKKSVWDYMTKSGSFATPAPQRSNSNSNYSSVRINVTAADGTMDRVIVIEKDAYTNEYESGADAEKLMNENHINFYAQTDVAQSIVATDDMNGMLLSLQTMDEVSYTMSFDKVHGEVYALRDNMTNTVVLMNEGATYNFVAQSNATLEGRFQIVYRQEMPTAVETVEETVNTPKAVYTIMGQYVGETTDWNNLPAGVYVVDGVKVIK